MKDLFAAEASRPGPVAAALAFLRADPAAAGWTALPFFRDGTADRVAAAVDGEIAAGATIAPAPGHVFRALHLTPLDRVKVVILGQDPYPKAGDAHGLAFSYVGPKAVPHSLRVILAELAADLGGPLPPARGAAPGLARGDLSGWAQEGVLLLNAALTTRVGESGAHLRLGWSRLTDEVVAAVSATRPAAVFLLWGNAARARAALVDRTRHLVLESGHPSPLNRARDFPGTRPFGRANAWLEERGIGAVPWGGME